MNEKRKKTEEIILGWLSDMDPSGQNTQMMKKRFSEMSDADFHEWMLDLKAKQDYVPLVRPNLKKSAITRENGLKVAEKRGIQLFQQLWLNDPKTDIEYLTPLKYLTIWVPYRRQIQLLVNKISIPKHNRQLNELSNQPTGDSKGSSLSFPELLVKYGKGQDMGILELAKVRGGDLEAMRLMDQSIIDTGAASLKDVAMRGTKPKIAYVIAAYSRAMHIDNNFDQV